MLHDPFFQDPFTHIQQMQQMMIRDPFMDGMLGPGLLAQQMQTAPAQRQHRHNTVIEEVDDEDREQDGTEPIIEEPDDEPVPRHQQRTRSSQYAAAPSNQLSMLDAPFGGFSMMTSGMGSGGGMYMSSSSFTSVSGPGGVTYQSSSQVRMGPGGVMEAKKKVQDGRTGTQTVALARGLGEQRRTIVRSRDSKGEEQSRDILQQIRPEEAHEFDQRWASAAEKSLPGWNNKHTPRLSSSGRRQQQPLALPSSESNADRPSSSRYQGAYGGAYSSLEQTQNQYGQYSTQYPGQYNAQYNGRY